MFGNAKAQTAFYEAFASHAGQSVLAAKLVLEMLEDPTKAPELSRQVSDAEHRGDKITHETIARLHKTWITPESLYTIAHLQAGLGRSSLSAALAHVGV